LAGSVTPRILSSRALALLETRERDSALHIIAYQPWIGVNEGIDKKVMTAFAVALQVKGDWAAFQVAIQEDLVCPELG
jgi:hypothetical protein